MTDQPTERPLSERMREYVFERRNSPRIFEDWADEVAQLERVVERAREAHERSDGFTSAWEFEPGADGEALHDALGVALQELDQGKGQG